MPLDRVLQFGCDRLRFTYGVACNRLVLSQRSRTDGPNRRNPHSARLDSSDAFRNCLQIKMELHSVREDDGMVSRDQILEQFCSLGFELVDRYGPVVVLVRTKSHE